MPKRYLLVAGTFLLSLLLYIDRAAISTAKSSITGGLDLTDKQFGWILSAFTLGYALAQTPSGILSDRFGPRIILTAVVSFWSLLPPSPERPSILFPWWSFDFSSASEKREPSPAWPGPAFRGFR